MALVTCAVALPPVVVGWTLGKTSGAREVFCPASNGSPNGVVETREKVGADKSSFLLNENPSQVADDGNYGVHEDGRGTMHEGSVGSRRKHTQASSTLEMPSNSKLADKYYFLHSQIDNKREINTEYTDLMDTT